MVTMMRFVPGAEKLASRRRGKMVLKLLGSATVAFGAALTLLLSPGVAAAQDDPPHVMVFSGTYGFHHSSIEHGNGVLQQLADDTGAFTVEFTVNPADINASKLAGVDLVLFNSTTGRFPLSQQQRDDFERWLGCGGGTMGVHASTDANYAWPLYAELFGAQFEAHPHGAADGETRMIVEDRGHPINAPWSGQDSFMLQDELYRWRRDPRGTQDLHVLLSLDESTVRDGIQDGALPYVHHQPLAWTKTFRGASRVYYTNLGHNEATWDRDDFQQSLVAGIQWVAEVRPDGTCIDSEGSKTTGMPSFRYPGALTVPPGQPCPEVEGAQVVRARDNELTVNPPPAPGYLAGARSNFVLDLSESGAQTADLAATASWQNPADDYDLILTTPEGFAGSQAIQPAQPSLEYAEVKSLRHCDLIHGDVLTHNATATPGVKLQLAVTPGPRAVAGDTAAAPPSEGAPPARPAGPPSAGGQALPRPELSVRVLRRASGRYVVALRATRWVNGVRLSVFRVGKRGRRAPVGERTLRGPIGLRTRRVGLPLTDAVPGARYVAVVEGTSGATPVRRSAAFRAPRRQVR